MNKLLYILITLSVLCSCKNSNMYNTGNCMHKIEEPVKTVNVLCPECKGTGKVKKTTAQNIGYAITSLGFNLLTVNDPVECGFCNGKGYVSIPDL